LAGHHDQTEVPTIRGGMMKRYLIVGYGLLNYLAFLGVFLYAVGFVGNLVVPRSVDHGVSAPLGQALVIDMVLLGLFAVPHSVMARPAFKRWLTRVLPPAMERSTYVLQTNLLLALLFWQWRSIPAVIWDVTTPALRVGLQVLFWIGWAIA